MSGQVLDILTSVMDDDARQTVLVIGGTGSLDRGVILALRDSGFTVVAASHRSPANPIAGVHYMLADLADVATIQPFIAQVVDDHGAIDGLVCISGSYTGGSFIQTDDHTWNEVVDLSLQSIQTAIQHVAQRMRDGGGGQIVLVAARPALDPTPSSAAGSAARRTVMTMTRHLARELRDARISVNCVLPGVVAIPPRQNGERHHDTTTPRDVGRVVALLLSDAARVISGAEIPINDA